jgi:hypothetical protein
MPVRPLLRASRRACLEDLPKVQDSGVWTVQRHQQVHPESMFSACPPLRFRGSLRFRYVPIWTGSCPLFPRVAQHSLLSSHGGSGTCRRQIQVHKQVHWCSPGFLAIQVQPLSLFIVHGSSSPWFTPITKEERRCLIHKHSRRFALFAPVWTRSPLSWADWAFRSLSTWMQSTIQSLPRHRTCLHSTISPTSRVRK